MKSGFDKVTLTFGFVFFVFVMMSACVSFGYRRGVTEATAECYRGSK